MSTRPKASIAVWTIASPPSGVATESVFGDRLAAGRLDLVDDELGGPGVAARAVDGAAEVVDDDQRARAAERQRVLAAEPAAAPVMIATLPSNPSSAMAGDAIDGDPARGRRSGGAILPSWRRVRATSGRRRPGLAHDAQRHLTGAHRLAVVVALALVFVIQNTERAPVELLFWERQTAVWVAIAIAIGIGVLLDRLVSTWWRRRRRDD